MKYNFTQKNLETAYLAGALFIGAYAICGFMDIPLSEWPIWACMVSNIALLYLLISIVGYYWLNYTLKELLRHFWDLFIVVSLSAYFIVNQIIQMFVKGSVPFTHLTR